MKRANKFTFSKNWLVLMNDMKIDTNDVLVHARLPADLFNQPEIILSPAEYFQLWQGLEDAAGDREFGLLLAERLSVEAFDPAIFACICSPDLNTALERLRYYKPLIGPMVLDIYVSPEDTRLEIECYGHKGEIPRSLGIAELIFFTQLARLATRKHIVPLSVQLPALPENIAPYVEYFGCTPSTGSGLGICFSAQDAKRPFMTSNAAMWDFFEGHLNQRLKDLDSSASTVERVKAVLLEALPVGESAMDQVAAKLAMSKRTLQRKLTSEAETFQSVLQQTRGELADHYLLKSSLSLGEISFMLGFQEPNSFIRAYSNWKGISPGQIRNRLQ